MMVGLCEVEIPASKVLHSFYPAILTICFFFFCFLLAFVPTYCGSNTKAWFVNKTGLLASMCYAGPALLLMYCERAISHMLGVLV